jgi:hypothetical protein
MRENKDKRKARHGNPLTAAPAAACLALHASLHHEQQATN